MTGKVNKNLVFEKTSSIVESEGLKLIDVEVKNSGDKVVLGLIIDKRDGVKIEDCERISKLIDPILDETEGVAGNYDYFTVASAGIDRPFMTTDDFLTHIGEKIEVKLYASVNKKKNISAVLKDANEEFIVLNENIKISRHNIQKANIAIEF